MPLCSPLAKACTSCLCVENVSAGVIKQAATYNYLTLASCQAHLQLRENFCSSAPLPRRKALPSGPSRALCCILCLVPHTHTEISISSKMGSDLTIVQLAVWCAGNFACPDPSSPTEENLLASCAALVGVGPQQHGLPFLLLSH